eukprot:973198-Rhodomonas_salina.2
MPATRERVLHLLLSEYDPTLGTFLEAPGPYSQRTKQVQLSPELESAGLAGWFWLHNQEVAALLSSSPSAPASLRTTSSPRALCEPSGPDPGCRSLPPL